MSVIEDISVGLNPLFDEARKTGKWFWCSYQDLWFTADELEREQAEGHFRWGAVNWKLRDPQEYLKEGQESYHRAWDEYVRRYKKVYGFNPVEGCR